MVGVNPPKRVPKCLGAGGDSTASQRRQWLDAYYANNLSKKEFAAFINIPEHTFRRWVKRDAEESGRGINVAEIGTRRQATSASQRRQWLNEYYTSNLSQKAFAAS